MKISPIDLAAEPQLWNRFNGFNAIRIKDLPVLTEAAFDALDDWDTLTTSEKDPDLPVWGASAVIGQYLEAFPKSRRATCRRFGRYFLSCNINVAFSAIRRFAYPVFSQYTMHVSDLLIEVACSKNPIRSPVEMTLRGIAFRALFELDRQYKYWPQLEIARDECIHGLRTWEGGREYTRRVAAEIERYLKVANIDR